MKKVLFFNTNQAWGGGEKWHLNMAISLKAQNYKVTICALQNGELAKKAKAQGLDVIEINLSNLSFLSLRKRNLVARVLKKLSPDAVIMNLPRDVKICAPLAKRYKVKKVIYRRGMPHPLKRNVLNRFIFSKVDSFIANSQTIKDSIVENFPELAEKTIVIYNGVLPKLNSLTPSQKPIRLTNIGRLVDQKGQKELIEVAKILKEKNLSFSLNIAGDGPLQETLQTLIENYNLQQEVQLLGHQNPEDVFSQTDIFVFTSQFEGSANALIEALQYQKVVVAFDISSNPEVITNGVNGILVPHKDYEAMANAIMELSINPKLCQEFQEKAGETIKSKFDYTLKVQEVMRLLES